MAARIVTVTDERSEPRNPWRERNVRKIREARRILQNARRRPPDAEPETAETDAEADA